MNAKKKYLNLTNIENSCWLDAIIVLIANNKNFKKVVENQEDSQIKKIITSYDDAVNSLNDPSDARKGLKQSKLILRALQKDTMKYLKEFLKFKVGEPESAFCALLNLIYQDKSDIKKHLNTTWIWHKQCINCNESTKSVMTKPIITLTKVKNFNPEAPTSISTCKCKSKRDINIEYIEVTNCLIFHFENGIGKGKSIPLEFLVKKREYLLTSVVLYQESEGSYKDHFITWIRQPFTGKWLECNDLNDKVVYFSNVQPNLKMKNVYLMVYETFDNLGKTKLKSSSIEDTIASNIKNIELIDLSDNKKSVLSCSSNIERKMESLPKNEKSAKGMVKPSVQNPEDITSNIKHVELTDLSDDKKSLLSCPSNVEMKIKSLPKNEKSAKVMVKPSIQNPEDITSNIKHVELTDLNDDKKLLSSTSNVEIEEECLPSSDKSTNPKNLVKPSIQNLSSSNETETSKDEVKSIIKPSKESLSHYESKASEEDKKPGMAKNSCNENEISKKTKMMKTDKDDLTNSHAASHNSAENLETGTRRKERFVRRPIRQQNRELSNMVDRIVRRTYYSFFDYICKNVEASKNNSSNESSSETKSKAEASKNSSSNESSSETKSEAEASKNSSSNESSSENKSEAECRPDYFFEMLSAMAAFSLSDAKSGLPNAMDSDKKE